MVLQKRLDYGFNGYQVPAMPRASRSARGRGAHRRKVADNQMFAFDLLATVAGKLLQESENSPNPSDSSAKKKKPSVINDMIKQEQEDEQRPLKEERYDQGSCDESVFGCHGKNQNCAWKELTHAQNVSVGGVSSITSYSDGSEKIDSSEKHLAIKSKNEFGRFPSKVVGGSPGYGESIEGKVEDISQRQLEVKPWNISSLKNGNLPDMCCSRDPMELDRKPPALVSSDSSVEEPLCRHHNPSVSFPGHQDDVKLATRDDDENSSGCTQPSTTIKTTRPPPRIGDRRIRKLLASKYWKVAPKLNDGEFSNTDGLMTLSYHNRKTFYTRQRSQRNSPYKRRKLIDQSSVSTSGICNSTEKFTNRDASGSSAKKLEASGASSSVAGQQKSYQSRDSHVKLSIKSFRIPELFIEIPETATVGSLKRTVMEAVTAILGGGLRVGVLLQGKKVRDDNKTLLQTGISHDNKLDTLGFTLEPNTAQTPTAMCHEDPPFLLPSEEPQPLTRHPAAPALDPENSEASPDTRLNDVGNYVESDHDSVPSPADLSNDKTTSDSRALVAIPTMSVEALAVVPLHRKSRRSELVQRRIRRPFSVLEVEALVQAVEKLGTGRWRDVKLRAFDNAKHRTYVDLKDKWKTLVHTARISPQQRRGEPVPQELLDRVLSAHAYWSQQQAKQQVKQQSETCLLL